MAAADCFKFSLQQANTHFMHGSFIHQLLLNVHFNKATPFFLLGSGIHQLFQMLTPIRQQHFFDWVWYPPRLLFLRCLGTVGTRCAWAQRAGALSKSVWFCKSFRFHCPCHCPQMRSVICPKAPSQWWGIICPKASPSMREHLRGALLS